MSKQLKKKKKPHRTPQKSDKKTWSLVRSNGSGVGMWKCKQTGETKTVAIALKKFIPRLGKSIDYMSLAGYCWFWHSC